MQPAMAASLRSVVMTLVSFFERPCLISELMAIRHDKAKPSAHLLPKCRFVTSVNYGCGLDDERGRSYFTLACCSIFAQTGKTFVELVFMTVSNVTRIHRHDFDTVNASIKYLR